MKILMGCFEMDEPVKFYVFCFYFACLILDNAGGSHLKTWKPNNNILNRKNWIKPDSHENCNVVEFGEINTAPIYIDKLAAKEFVLPVSGEINILDGGYLKLVDQNSREKTNCLKLKELQMHDYQDPTNWDSDVSSNPAVPDREKLPCRDDTIKLNDIYSGMQSTEGYHVVSSVLVGNKSVASMIWANDIQLRATQGICRDPSGCVCNEEQLSHCPPPSKKADCLSPVHPTGFCHPICGAFTTFKPAAGFSIKEIEDILKDYSGVYSHISKVDQDLIQVVFAEKDYSGDSVVYAQDFMEKLQKDSSKFRISNLKSLTVSGAQINGNASFANVFFSSLLFVLGIFAFIFCVYGDRRWLTHFRFSPSSLPLSSTYRARFSTREDESGLIFDTQSIAGSVLNLRQSFDNPMFTEAFKDANTTETERNNSSETNASEEEPQIDPIFVSKDFNEVPKEEIGTDVVEDIEKSNNFKTNLVSAVPPLIDIEEIEG